MARPVSINTADYAGQPTQRLDHLKIHASKRVTGVTDVAHDRSFAGVSTRRIAQMRYHAAKQVRADRNATEVQNLMWQQCGAPNSKSSQTEALSFPFSDSLSAGHSSADDSEWRRGPAGAASGHHSDGSKLILRRHGEEEEMRRGFNTRWQPDPTDEHGARMGLFLNRNSGCANLEVDPGKMDMLATYHREKAFGPPALTQNHIQAATPPDEDEPPLSYRSEGRRISDCHPASIDQINARMTPRGSGNTCEIRTGWEKRLSPTHHKSMSSLAPQQGSLAPPPPLPFRGRRHVEAPWTKGEMDDLHQFQRQSLESLESLESGGRPPSDSCEEKHYHDEFSAANRSTESGGPPDDCSSSHHYSERSNVHFDT